MEGAYRVYRGNRAIGQWLGLRIQESMDGKMSMEDDMKTGM